MIPAGLARALGDDALVVVQAPAGFGKTTSVRAALDAEPNLAWYDAQPWEAAAARRRSAVLLRWSAP